MKTSLRASIRIDSEAWERVRNLAASRHRPLSEIIGQLLEEATAEQGTEAAGEAQYEAPPLTSAFVRPHPDTLPSKRSR